MKPEMIAVDITIVCPDCKDLPEEQIVELIQKHKSMIKEEIVKLCRQE